MKTLFKILLIPATLAQVAFSAVCADFTSNFAAGDGSADEPFEIGTAQQLQDMNLTVGIDPGCYFKLTQDIDLTEFLAGTEAGWLPIGTSSGSSSFSGKVDGNKHKVTGLWINRPSNSLSTSYVGLFGYITSSEIKDIGVEIDDRKGGVVGYQYVGGIAGSLESNCIIKNSYAIGKVSGYRSIGGIAGRTSSYTNTITNCYARGRVSGSDSRVGGIIGEYYSTVNYCYAANAISGNSSLYGIYPSSSSASNYFDNDVARLPSSISHGGTAKTTAEMTKEETYASWDFDDTWAIEEDLSYPFFQWQENNFSVAAIENYYFPGYEITPKPTVTLGGSTLTENQDFVYEYLNNNSVGTATVFAKGIGTYEGLEQRAYFNILAPACNTATFAGGTGTAADPFQISNAYQLNLVRHCSGNSYKLTADIDLTALLENSTKGWDPIKGFSGKMDGDGHRVTGLWINRPDEDSVGFFRSIYGSSSTSKAEIKKFGVEINNAKGGVVGYQYVGGLVGRAEQYITISQTYSVGNVTGMYRYAGGLVGYSYYNTTDSEINDSYASGHITEVNGYALGGVVGRGTTVKNSLFYGTFFINNTSGSIDIGGIYGTNTNASNSYYDNDLARISSSSTTKGTPKSTALMKTRSTYDQWNFGDEDSYDPDSNTWEIAENSYPFFQWQANSIYIAGIAAIGEMYYTGDAITPKPKVSIRSVELTEGTDFEYVYENNHQLGVATLIIRGKGSYEGQEQKTTFIIKAGACGAGIAEGTGTLEDPYKITNAGELQALNLCRGTNYSNKHFALQNDIDLADFLANSTEGWLPILSFYGNVNGNFRKVENLWINRPASQCNSYLSLNSCDSVGLFGSIRGTIENLGVETTGNGVIGKTGVGILAGSYIGTSGRLKITNSYATGKATGNTYVGGLIGRSHYTDITNSYASGEATGVDYVGGLTGSGEYADIKTSYAEVNVYASGLYAGGLIGYLYSSGSVMNSYATGSVNAAGDAYSSHEGGLIGINTGTVTNCYAVGSVNNGVKGEVNSSIGGLIGSNLINPASGNVVASSFYDANTTGQDDASKGTPRNTTQMKTQSTFTGWDFANIWEITAGNYPTLRWQDPTDLTIALIENIGNEPWTGYAIEPTPKIYDVNNTELTAGTDFDYEYKNNFMVSDSAVMKITGKGEYRGTKSVYFSITPKDCIADNFGGGTGAESDPYLVSEPGHLYAMKFCLGETNANYYKLTADIDLAEYLEGSTSGWQPIGGISSSSGTSSSSVASFYGKVDGDGHKVTGLWINRPSTNYTGLFGYMQNGEIKNLGLELDGKKVIGREYTGGLVGSLGSSTISGSYVIGSVSSGNYYYVGGLAGVASGSSIVENSYAVGSVNGSNYVGGLIGNCSNNTIKNSYAAGGTVAGTGNNSYLGGLIGYRFAGTMPTVIDSYYDSETSLQTDAGKGTGKTTEEMQTQSTYANWDFNGIWEIREGVNSGYPTLIWQNQNHLWHATIDPIDPQVYDGTAKTPVPKISMGETELENETDFDLSYANNTNYGTATITITGKGSYSGVRTVQFQITKTQLVLTLAQQGTTYGQELPEYEITGSFPSDATQSAAYSIKDADNWSSAKPQNAGEYTIRVTIGETDNYAEKILHADFTIEKAELTLTLTQGNAEYGKPLPEPVLQGNLGSGLVSFSYKAKDAADDAYTSAQPTAIGEYIIRAIVEPSDNYFGGTATAEFEITKTNPILELSQEGTTWGTPLPSPVLVCKDVDNDVMDCGEPVTYEYSSNGTEWSEEPPTAAGEYRIRANVAETEEYSKFSVVTTFTINKLTPPELATPSGLTGKVGQTLSEIELPPQWSWQTESKKLTLGDIGNLGTSVVYTPTKEQLNNYKYEATAGYDPATNTLSRSVTVSVSLVPTQVVVIPIPNRAYTGQEIKPLVLVGIYLEDELVLLPSPAYRVAYANNVNIGKATVSITGSTAAYSNITATATFNITEATPIFNSQLSTLNSIPLYYTMHGKPLGSAKPTVPGIYIEKIGEFSRRVVVR